MQNKSHKTKRNVSPAKFYGLKVVDWDFDGEVQPFVLNWICLSLEKLLPLLGVIVPSNFNAIYGTEASILWRDLAITVVWVAKVMKKCQRVVLKKLDIEGERKTNAGSLPGIFGQNKFFKKVYGQQKT